MTFVDRVDAGRQLAGRLTRFRDADVVVLGLPRGGVAVAYEVATALDAPLDVIVVRKLGAPGQPELGMGAIGEDGVRIVNPAVVASVRASEDDVAAVEARERTALAKRVQLLRERREPVALAGRTAVIVDDGVATGSTARVACKVARARGAARVVLAVPVASADTVESLRRDADEVICVNTPAWLFAIGEWYVDFSPTSEDDVRDLLARAASAHPDTARPAAGRAPSAGTGPYDDEVVVRVGGLGLPGRLTVPENATGVVVFVHGSGSSRHSPRNRYVASVLQSANLGTLLFDLLTPGEEADRANVFDLELLARRLSQATTWLREQPGMADPPIGWFGASTGAGAALRAAAEPGADVAAIVSRGGRPDLAGDRLVAVTAPTLLIVGGLDTTVLELNEAARARLRCPTELAVVPGATHLFEEPGTLEQAAVLARDWFTRHLRPLAHARR